jgi:hypothetical protein
MTLIYEWIQNNWRPILVTSILIPFLFFLIKYFWNNYFFVVTISPSVKKISCNSKSYRKESYYVYLTNNSSSSIYDINIWATHPKEIEVNISPEGRKSESQSLGNIIMDSSAFKIFSVGGTQTVINNLAPKETIKLQVEINEKNYYGSFKLKLKAKVNSKSPKPVISAR